MTDAEHRRDGDRGKATLREIRDRGRMVRRRNVAAVALLASSANVSRRGSGAKTLHV